MSETKICKCICCGREIEVTKFASPLKTKCDDCKKAKLEPNEDILNEIKADNQSGKKNNTSGSTKVSKCIRCGKEVIVSKFASHQNTICDDCRGTDNIETDIRIDLSKVDYDVSSPNNIYITPSIIPNKKLRDVTCPACGTGMNIIKINDCSPQWGMIITYQCKDDDCMLIMNVSEQSRTRMKPSPISKVFNYRGEEIRGIITPIADTRIKNIIDYLLSLLEEHNIPVDGIEVPDVDGSEVVEDIDESEILEDYQGGDK